MMNHETLSELGELDRPATDEEIGDLQAGSHVRVPEAYISLLRLTNGMLIHSQVKLYSTVELRERNHTFEVQRYLPGWLLIGDDSGGYGVFLNLTKTPAPVLLIDHGSLSEEDAVLLAKSLPDWFAEGAPVRYE